MFIVGFDLEERVAFSCVGFDGLIDKGLKAE